jgi:hypothetical protein
MGERSDFDLTPGADDGPRPATVVQIRERIRVRPAGAEVDNHDPIQDWDTHHAGSLQLPVLDRPAAPLADAGAAEGIDKVSLPHDRQRDCDADIFNLQSAPILPAATPPIDQTGPEEETTENQDGGEGAEDPPPQQSTSLRREPVAAPRRTQRRTVAGIALGAVITIAVVIAGLAVSAANHHTRPVSHMQLAATAAPLTSTLDQDASAVTKSISADLIRAAKAVKARAAAVAATRARQARARARATKARAARARAARLHKRRKPTHPQTTQSSPPSDAAATSTYTQPTPAPSTYTQPTPAPSAPAKSSSPSTATTSHQTTHPYGDGGLLGPGSSPSG